MRINKINYEFLIGPDDPHNVASCQTKEKQKACQYTCKIDLFYIYLLAMLIRMECPKQNMPHMPCDVRRQ